MKKAQRFSAGMWARAAWALSLGAVLAGCVSVGPDYEPPELPVPESWRNAPEAAEAAPAATAGAWWTVFGDATLDGIVARVHRNNQSLAAAVATMDSYAARLNMERAGWGPSVAASGKAGYDRQPETVHAQTEYPDNPEWLYNAGVSFQWELDLWGRVRRAVEAARGELEASEEDVRAVRLELEAAAAAEYIRLRTLQRQTAYAETNAALQEESAKLARGRFDAGLVGELDVKQADMNLAATRSRIPQLQAETASSLDRLCVLAGELPGAFDTLLVYGAGAIPDAAAGGRLPAAVPSDLLRRRPDVRAAERRLAAQTARIGVAKGDFFPKLSLNGSFSLSTTYSDKFFDSASQGFFLGPGFDWALFTAGKIKNRVRAEEAAAKAALAQYRQTALSAFGECESAFAAYRGAKASASELALAVASASEAVELAENLYRNGLTDFQNVLDMLRQLSAHQDSLAQTQGAAASRLVDIHKAVGGGIVPAGEAAETTLD